MTAPVTVADPDVARLEDDGAVRGFLEKPAADEIDTNLISAGAYVLHLLKRERAHRGSDSHTGTFAPSPLELLEPPGFTTLPMSTSLWPALPSIGDRI